MKNNWQIKKIGEICNFQNGFAFKSSEYEDSGFFVMRIGNVQDGYISLSDPKFIKKSHKPFDKFILQSGDILISLTGNVGRVGVIDENHLPAVINQRVARIALKNEIIIKKGYLLYFLKSSYFIENLIGAGHGAAQQNISTKDIEDLEISYPESLSEQLRIVKILDEVFDRTAKATENAKKNLQNARELFKSYSQSIFANNGDGWKEEKINEVCELKSGTTISPSLERKNGNILYTKIADMNLPENFIEIRTSSRFVNSNEIKKNQIIPEGAIIFPKRGGAIATNKKRKIVKPTIVDLNTMAIIPGNKIDNEYFYHWFKLIDLNSISNGTSIPQINNYSFDEIYIPYPISIKEQKLIVTKLDALSDETKKLEAIYKQKITDLEELKKSLLKRAFNGDL